MRVFAGIPQMIAVQNGQNIDNRERTTDMNSWSSVSHIQHVFAEYFGVKGFAFGSYLISHSAIDAQKALDLAGRKLQHFCC